MVANIKDQRREVDIRGIGLGVLRARHAQKFGVRHYMIGRQKKKGGGRLGAINKVRRRGKKKKKRRSKGAGAAPKGGHAS